MPKRKSLIPYHFGTKLDIIPNRDGVWTVIDLWSLADRIQEVKRQEADIVVSGDCMAAIGAHRKGLPLVWYDAHGDFNTLKTTKTGSPGGMVLGMLAGIGDNSLLDVCDIEPVEKIIHVGLAEPDPGEESRMINKGVKLQPYLDKYDLQDFKQIHLHVDLDVIGSQFLSSNFHPTTEGMNLDLFWEQMELCRSYVKVLSVKSYNPQLDHAGVGQDIILELIRRFSV